MQKVICPYCGRVAKYVDSSVIYYGHSYGIWFASRSPDMMNCSAARARSTSSAPLWNLPMWKAKPPWLRWKALPICGISA